MIQRFLKIISITSVSFAIGHYAHAQTTAVSQNQSVKLVYDIYNRGIHVITVRANYVLTPTNYNVDAKFSSAGIASLVFSLDTDATVSGIFKNGHALPGTYQSTGKDKNGKFRLVINYNHGQKTEITMMEPGKEDDRDALTEEQKKYSIDMLSAMADLIYRVRTIGKCDDQFNLLDGLRVYSFRSQTIGESEIPSTWTSPYRGQALLCSAVAQQIGGFKTYSRRRALMAQPQPGSIWFKNIDGIGYLPARFDFKNPKMGMITGVLRQIPTDKK